MTQAVTHRASGCQRPSAAQLPFRCKGDSAGAGSRVAGQRFPHWCNMTEDCKDDREDVTTEPTTASPPDPFAGEDRFCQDKNVLVFPLKNGRCGIPSRLNISGEEDPGRLYK